MSIPLYRDAGRADNPASAATRSQVCLSIGIDFGTTFSGVAWASVKKANEIEVITNWEQSRVHGTDRLQVPTKIYYDTSDDQTIIHWGYDIPDDVVALEWFKLKLMDDCYLPMSFLEKAHNRLEAANKQPIDVIADYLRQVWQHSYAKIATHIGAETLTGARKQIMITLPAMWSAAAQDTMKQAAGLAGILNENATLAFVPEPHAAALATLKDHEETIDDTITPGGSLVVVDCGGGTVDLTSYTITKKLPMELKECGHSVGALCGAKFLDDEWEKMFRAKAGDHVYASLSNAERARIRAENWENGIKSQWGGKKRPEIIAIGKHRVTISKEDIETIFSKVFIQILEMIDNQVTTVLQTTGKNPRYIILVGGFGRCRYLYETIREKMNPIEILQSTNDNPWTAVCRGAVMEGLALQNVAKRHNVPSVVSRLAKFSYGVCYREEWQKEKRHALMDKVWDDLAGCYMADKQMDWYITRGANMEKKRPIIKKFSGRYDEIQDSIDVVIYQSDLSRPPKRLTDDVEESCTITVDCGDIDWSTVPTEWNQAGIKLYKIEFAIQMTRNGCTVNFDVLYKGKNVGSQTKVMPCMAAQVKTGEKFFA